ncbi:hypothetical protein KC675_01400 [Candidatus Dojkabacteria bacterium]|uniref:Uncharacterized protein n=1 Tax=Candidatus Dojkabacteria bacterium TaxID=2099670 RepID=A0A955I8A4_9BACT|nr:hypothetical protein [Candidatus Dojkabacteria bacterium]
MKITNNDKILIIAFIVLGFLTRTIFTIGPNVEFVTIASLGAGYFMNNKKLALIVPLVIMALSDAVIGNTSIFIFTWSAFLLTPIIGIALSKINIQKSTAYPALVGLSGSILSVIIFFLWTNFGVVVTTAMYPDTISGLINSYINALPFLKNQLYGNMIFAPMIFTLVALARDFYEDKFRNLKEAIS